MALTVLLGGVRSGKSSLAVRWGADSKAPVTFLATGEARDEEMAQKIRQHKADRPSHWMTVEEPIELEREIANADPSAFLIIDCLTLWVSNLIEKGFNNAEIQQMAAKSSAVAAARDSRTIAVTNEVGLGIISENALARRFSDVLGKVNKTWVDAAHETYVMFAGRSLRL